MIKLRVVWGSPEINLIQLSAKLCVNPVGDVMRWIQGGIQG